MKHRSRLKTTEHVLRCAVAIFSNLYFAPLPVWRSGLCGSWQYYNTCQFYWLFSILVKNGNFNNKTFVFDCIRSDYYYYSVLNFVQYYGDVFIGVVMHMYVTAKMRVACGKRTRRKSVAKRRIRGRLAVTLMFQWIWQTVLMKRTSPTCLHHGVPLKQPLLLRFGFLPFAE